MGLRVSLAIISIMALALLANALFAQALIQTLDNMLVFEKR